MKRLLQICSDARKRWDLGQLRIIHRIDFIPADAQIVFVGVTSKHRKAAFEACAFIMDYLKTNAPLWKQECTSSGARWVDSKTSDVDAAQRWDQQA